MPFVVGSQPLILGSALLGSAYRTSVRAGTAVNASVSVDHVLAVTL